MTNNTSLQNFLRKIESLQYMNPSKVNSVLLTIIVALGAWGISEVVSIGKKVEKIEAKIEVLEMLAYRSRSSVHH